MVTKQVMRSNVVYTFLLVYGLNTCSKTFRGEVRHTV